MAAMRGRGGIERADERELEQDVDDSADRHRADHRKRDVPLRVGGLAAKLDRLLEAEVGEDHPAGGDRAEDALGAGRIEAVAGAEVRAAEADDQQHHDRERRDGDLPA